MALSRRTKNVIFRVCIFRLSIRFDLKLLTKYNFYFMNWILISLPNIPLYHKSICGLYLYISIKVILASALSICKVLLKWFYLKKCLVSNNFKFKGFLKGKQPCLIRKSGYFFVSKVNPMSLDHHDSVLIYS